MDEHSAVEAVRGMSSLNEDIWTDYYYKLGCCSDENLCYYINRTHIFGIIILKWCSKTNSECVSSDSVD